MKKYLTALVLLVSASVSIASPIVWNDKWTGQDKTLHLVAGSIIGSAVTAYTDNATYGIIAGCSAGLLKEVYDKHNRSILSLQDAAVSCAGAFIGSKITEGLYLTPNRIVYRIEF